MDVVSARGLAVDDLLPLLVHLHETDRACIFPDGLSIVVRLLGVHWHDRWGILKDDAQLRREICALPVVVCLEDSH